ncbi:hypothetical protein M9458_035007, partial [Cirrhinus mrigala]
LSQGGNKGLETIRKVFSHSVGSGIKTALAKVFRKPPSVKSVNKATSQYKNKTVKDFEQKQENAEVLTSTKQWVAAQKETAGWAEHVGWEEPNASSDCDSIFSLDSLSSAYARALAEQLQQEECDSSDAESEDSQMSQDSLVMESSGKHVTAKSVLRFNKVPSHLTTPTTPTSCSSQAIGNKEQMRISKDVPAEVFWSLNGSQKLKTENAQGMARESTHISESRPCSGASNRETENPFALTDAWSSTDAADSPRIIRASGHLIKQDPHTLIESSRCQSSTSLDLSDNTNVSESQSSPHSDSTQDGNTTLEEQNDTSFENTLLLESDLSFIPGQEMDFTALATNEQPCTTHRVCNSTNTNSDGVADPNNPTTQREPLNPTVTKALLVNSCSKDDQILTSTSCFPVNSSRAGFHVRKEASSYPVYPDSTDTNLDGVADPSKTTTQHEPLNPTATKALLISSCSKDGQISTNTSCFPVNSSREDLHVRKDPLSYPMYHDSTDSSLSGVADPSKPTTQHEPLNPTVTKALLINSCSEDGQISTSTNCFLVNSSREDLHGREEPSSYPMYHKDCSLKSNLNVTVCYQVSTCDSAKDPEVKNSKAVQILDESHNNASTDNGKTTGHCDEEKKYFYTKQCIEMACATDTKNYALTIEESKKRDEVVDKFVRDGEHFGV